MSLNRRSAEPNLTPITVIAQDPSFLSGGRILRTELKVPTERLRAGPAGARVRVLDYDSSTGTLYRADPDSVGRGGLFRDRFKQASDSELLRNPAFHAQNVYAIVVATLARFERALGRRISWGFGGHQIFVVPHAFCEANAFYDETNRSLLFGYYPEQERQDDGRSRERIVFSCLSHDVVVHETTHALLDGLRDRFTEPSSLAQEGFHEGFSDVVALLSVLASREMVQALLTARRASGAKGRRLRLSELTPQALAETALFTLADQMGPAFRGAEGGALRASLKDVRLDTSWRRDLEFEEPHRHGEILVKAVLQTFLLVWRKRLLDLARGLGRASAQAEIDAGLVAQEGADAADSLLNVMIRALDYTPPTHITYPDFLSAVLTADREAVPDDSRFEYRRTLSECFAKLGIRPASRKTGDGTWEGLPREPSYERIRFESILRDREEMFRFLWENRSVFGLEPTAYTRVESVRPVMRLGPDGFMLRETVAEYTQRITVEAGQLGRLGIAAPDALDRDRAVTLWGGGTVILDEYGHVKFHVRNRVLNRKLQTARLAYQVESGQFTENTSFGSTFGRRHLARQLGMRAFRRLQTF